MTHLCPIFRLGNIANGKLQLFINLNQSKHHCYTLSTTCTLFKLAIEVGPRTNNLHIQIFYFSLIFYIKLQNLTVEPSEGHTL